MSKTTYYDPRAYSLPTGDDLRSMRERLDLSLRDAADQAGLDHSYIGRIERGERYSRDAIEKLLELYRELWPDDDEDPLAELDHLFDDLDENGNEPIETIAIPIDVATKGKAAVAEYLVERGYEEDEIADELGVATRTVWQYVNDVRAGRRG